MGCCESTPDLPDELLPDPTVPTSFKVQSLSSWNRDYEVLSEAGERWLFLNSDGGKVDLENYVRNDPDKPKKGEVLWTAKWDGTWETDQEYESDSDSDWSDVLENFFGATEEEVGIKWKMKSSAKLKPVKGEGREWKIKFKAKGKAERKRVLRCVNEDGEKEWDYEEDKEVKQLYYKLTTYNDDMTETEYKFHCLGKLEGGKDLTWDCPAFSCFQPKGFGGGDPAEVTTKEGFDPGMALLVAHIVSSEFVPSRVLGRLSPRYPPFSDGTPGNAI